MFLNYHFFLIVATTHISDVIRGKNNDFLDSRLIDLIVLIQYMYEEIFVCTR